MYVHNFDPIALKLGSFELSYYWLAYLIGFWVVLYFLFRLKKEGLTPLSRNDILDYMLFGWIGLLVGARLGYAIFYNWDLFMEHPDYFYKIWMGGMSFHGALVGIIIIIFFTTRYKKQPFFCFFDIAAIPTPLVLGFGRIANFINGEIWGRVTNVPWAVNFGRPDNLPRHPSQLYQAMCEGFLCFIILWLLRRNLKKEGILSSLFLIFYGTFRFLIEFFRAPDKQVGFIWQYFTMGQILCVIMIIAGTLIYLYQLKKIET